MSTTLGNKIRNLRSYSRTELISQGDAIKEQVEQQRLAGEISNDTAAQLLSDVNNETSRILRGADKRLYTRPKEGE